jgi:hypothetical protein
MISIMEPNPPFSLPRNIGTAYTKGFHMMAQGWALNLPFIALEAGAAQRGEMLPIIAGRTAGMLAQPVMGGIVSAGLVASLGLPPVAAAVAATMLIAVGSNYFENKLIRGIQMLKRETANAQRLSFGQGFKDNPTARAMRMRAVQEMNYTLVPSRRWLGQEARILHR